MTCFREFFNPATGELIKFTDTAETTSGELARFAWKSVPGGVITEHVHPHQEERFTITSGQARFTVNGQERHARAGETLVVPAGVPHSEGNPGPQTSRASSSSVPPCARRNGMKPSPAWSPTSPPRREARPGTSSSLASPSGTSGTKAASHPQLPGSRT
jgi:quercetin dioxygenase-like cupin family protein